MTLPGIEPESTVSVVDALSTRPLIGCTKCTEALSVSVEDWSEVQGKQEESTVDREKLADERKARFIATPSTDAIWYKSLRLSSNADLSCPIFYRNFKSWGARAKYVLLLAVINITVDFLSSHGNTSKEQEHPAISKKSFSCYKDFILQQLYCVFGWYLLPTEANLLSFLNWLCRY